MKSKIINICAAIILAVTPLSLFAQDPAMYVYRTNGAVNGFLMSQVDSLSYSNMGLDSVEYDIPVVQQIWTKKGLYQVAISDIDSIGYYTPEPVYKSGLFIIDENNVAQVAGVDFDKMTISFSSNTLDAELPKKDQVIFCDLEEDPFPMGFSGRVTNVRKEGNKHTFECEVAGPEEVYERLLLVGHVGPDGHKNNVKRKSPPKKAHHEGSYNINTTLFNLLTVSGKGTVSIDYTLDINAFNSKPATFWLRKQHDIDLEFKLGVETKDMEGALTSRWDKDLKVKEFWEPPFTLYTVGGILDVDLMLGCYFEYGNTFSIEASGIKYKYTDIDEYSWSSENPLYMNRNDLYHEGGWNVDGVEDIFDKFKLKAELNGKVSFGLTGELDIAVWKPKWMSLGLQLKIGPELKGSFALDTDFFKSDNVDTGLYKFFSEDLKLTLGVKVGLDLNARYNYDEWKIFSASTTMFPRTVTLLPKLSKPALPKIYEISPNNFMLETFDAWDRNLGWNSNDPMSIRTIAKNITLFPGPIGFSIYDEGGNQIYNEYCDLKDWHWINTSSFARSIKGLKPQKIKVYPMYKVFGFIPVKAEPSIITIPKPLSLSSNSAETKVGENVTLTLNDGWGYYHWSCTDNIASLAVKEKDGVKYIEAHGLRPGNATVEVKDVRSGDTESFELTVKSSGLDLSTYDLTMNPNDVRTVTVFPRGEYQLTNSVPSVATAKMLAHTIDGKNSSVIQVTAHKVGRTTVIVSDAQNEHSLSFTVHVTNNYLKPGFLKVDPATINFGDVPAGGTRSGQFTISNTGDKELKFRIVNTCDVFDFLGNDWMTTLEPSKSLTLDVEFTPKKAGQNYECDVIIQTDASNGNQVLKLTGHGVEPSKAHINVTPTVLDFGEVEVHTSKTMQFTVNNTGESRTYFTISEPSTNVFKIPQRDEDISLFPNKEKDFNVLFNPEQVGKDYECEVIISSDAENGNQILKLKGKGKEYEDYVHGVCSGFTPEDGAVVDASSGYVTLDVHEFILPQDGQNVFAVSLSVDPSRLTWGKTGGWSITWNGHKGEKRVGSNWYDLYKVEAGTTYYWQVEYFDWEKDSFVKCSPILTFTTLP